MKKEAKSMVLDCLQVMGGSKVGFWVRLVRDDNEKQQLLCSALQFKKWREKFEEEEEK